MEIWERDLAAQLRRSEIFVEPRTKKKSSPVGAKYAAPTELGNFFCDSFYKYVAPTALAANRKMRDIA
ncbi:MAG TPA: hypothetical protein VGH42_01845 [Verrucomicrobiae bacterium]|jgi:hypothetical protein